MRITNVLFCVNEKTKKLTKYENIMYRTILEMELEHNVATIENLQRCTNKELASKCKKAIKGLIDKGLIFTREIENKKTKKIEHMILADVSKIVLIDAE